MQIKLTTLRRIQGTFLSIIFALIGALPWVIIGYFGWISSLAGFAIGWMAHRGYILGNKSFDRFGKIILALVILFVVPLAELVNVSIAFLVNEYTFVESLAYAPMFFIEYIGDYLPNILIGYLLAALGTYRFFTNQE